MTLSCDRLSMKLGLFVGHSQFLFLAQRRMRDRDPSYVSAALQRATAGFLGLRFAVRLAWVKGGTS